MEISRCKILSIPIQWFRREKVINRQNYFQINNINSHRFFMPISKYNLAEMSLICVILGVQDLKNFDLTGVNVIALSVLC